MTFKLSYKPFIAMFDSVKVETQFEKAWANKTHCNENFQQSSI